MKKLKNKNYGFTLIELLATIVILGLLELIVTPGIAKVIRNSKINTAKASLEGYVREIENASTLYLTDTGDYPTSIDVLEIDGKNISKIKNPIVELSNGGVVKVTAKIDGLYCIYEKGINTICQEESFYSYIKNSIDVLALLEKSGISEICWYDYNNNVDFCDEEGENVDWDAFNEEYYGKFFGIEIPKSKIKSIEFTNIKPNGVGIDVSLNNTNDVLLYYTVTKEKIDVSLNDNSNIMFLSDVETRDVTDEMYDIKIYSEKEIMFPEDSSEMFADLNYLDELVLENINTSRVIDMSGMFGGTGSSSEVFTLDLGDKFDTSNVTSMAYMFRKTGKSSTVFTLDLGNKFDTSNVTNMEKMFSYTGKSSEVFMLDLGDKFDTSNVTNMSSMFRGSPNLKTIYVSNRWNTNAVTESTNMFYRCSSLPNFNSSVVDKTNAHYGEGGYLTLKTN